jgi:Zn-dependent protease
MFHSEYRIATVWGIPIKVHISLIVLLGLVAIGSASEGATAVVGAILFGVCVVAGIALHELGHSLVAIRKGCRVREISLMFIGGAAQMERIPTRPLDELQMALAGPAVSVVLGFACWMIGGHLPLSTHYWPIPLVQGALIQCDVVQYLGVINLGLAVFNLLPSFPMDGGRVFRALLTPRLGRLKATFVAARLGRIIAIVMGLYGFLSTPARWILVAIAFFIYTAAGNEYKMVAIQEAMKQRGMDGEGSFRDLGTEPETGDRVVISPPPYRDGRPTETRIREDEDGPPL